ncbi:TetR-like C-terminal domain-containing protein [Streptomyces sp. NPDC006551]|uniref:TetR-like C-terminal domain-containing protein n=1 Tax=Streptomyces sp. NPDC006551 TaxID=3157178 RepID=UPI00339E2351
MIHECDGEPAERFHELIVTGVIEPPPRLFGEVTQRGIGRGEVRPDVTGELLFDVIPVLVMYRSKMCASEWADSEIAAVIDQIMVSLLRP